MDANKIAADFCKSLFLRVFFAKGALVVSPRKVPSSLARLLEKRHGIGWLAKLDQDRAFERRIGRPLARERAERLVRLAWLPIDQAAPREKMKRLGQLVSRIRSGDEL